MPDNTTDSRPPREKKITPSSFRFEKGGISANWRTLLLLGLVLASGGSIAGVSLLPNGITFSPGETEEENVFQNDHKKTHEVIGETLEEHAKVLDEQGKVIGEVKYKIDEVQTVQHKQFARDEARRATEGIKDLAARIREYDRLVDINMKRLGRGNDPCSTINCEN